VDVSRFGLVEKQFSGSSGAQVTRSGHIIVNFMKFSGGLIEGAIRGPNFGEEHCNQRLVKFNSSLSITAFLAV